MKKWHRINFKIKWDGNPKNVRWFIDLLIIDLLIRPTIENFRPKLEVWRFHRRANNDSSGHQLSFIFYTTSTTTKNVFDYLTSNRLKIIVDNYLEVVRLDLMAGKDNIEATSDDSWPIEIQRSWPYYIMGVCEMFIKLIKEVKENITNQVKEGNKEELEDYYKEIEKKVDEIWLKHGCHAFIHHLSAIIGYKPVIVQKRGIDHSSERVIF